MTTIRTAHPAFTTTAPGKALNIALWTLQVLVALAFVAAGSRKLLGTSDMVALFDAVGIGQWFRYVTGSLEVLGALLLVLRGKAALGAVLLACVMAGAIVAQSDRNSRAHIAHSYPRAAAQDRPPHPKEPPRLDHAADESE